MHLLKRLPKVSRAQLVLGVTLVIAGYFLVMGATSALRSSQLGDQEDRLRAELTSLQQRYQRLEALREYLNAEEYIEAVAREQLGLVREGETAIVVIPAPPDGASEGDEESAGPAEDELWWETLIR
jgi:cell division protein FtsB